jgi:hypothetical protein
MKKLFPILSSILFLIGFSLLVIRKIAPYDFNLSALIGIWQGFAELNPEYLPKNFVVFREGGYDGQFFFFLSRYIFDAEIQSFPVLDSFYFRFHRIGLSILAGIPGKIFGFSYYPALTLTLLVGLHLSSFLILEKVLRNKDSRLSMYYLISPYSLVSLILLLSDSLLVSLGIIAIYFLHRSKNLPWLIGSSLLLSLTLLVRETSLFIILPLGVWYIFQKDIRRALASILPLLVYGGFLLFTQNLNVENPGTNPLKFRDMTDLPLVGFWESFGPEISLNPKSILTELIKIYLFILYIVLGSNLLNLIRSEKEAFLASKGTGLQKIVHLISEYFRPGSAFWRDTRSIQALSAIPILATFGIISIAEVGYWKSFDNLSRMFLLPLPIILILKAKIPGYRDYGFLILSGILFLFVVLRILFITKPMSFFLTG